MRFLKYPLVQFLLIGAVIYLAYAFFTQQVEETEETTIVIRSAEVAWMDAMWEKRMMRPATEEEREGMLKQQIQEMVFHREAIALGLDQNDPVIRRQLAMKLERMVQDLATGIEPTEEELKGYFEAHKADYLEPERLTLTQIFFDPDKRGDTTLSDAEAEKLKFQALENPLEAAQGQGDSFMLQSYYPERTEMDVAKVLGRGFAESAFDLTEGEWHGPILSGYGVHLVYVHSRLAPAEPQFTSIKDRVLQDYQVQQRLDAEEKYIESLLEKYEVVIEEKSTPEPNS